MKSPSTVAALVFAFSATSLQAEVWYLGVKGGVTFPRDGRFDGRGGSTDLFRSDEKRGYTIGGQLGYDMGLLRLEADGSYQKSKLRALTSSAYTPLTPGTLAAKGSHDSWNLMLNALLDIVNMDRLTVSVGGGAGAVRTRLRDYRATGQAAFLDDRDWSFGYQGIVGARYAVSDSMDLTLDYRYLEARKARFTDALGAGITGKFRSHAALVGVALKFGGSPAESTPPVETVAAPSPEPAPAPAAAPGPEAAPAPVPAPEPVAPPAPGPFIVFFDWNEARLAPEAQKILRNAVASFRTVGMARIMVAGYADRSGTDSHNEGLSLRRAEAVKAFLVQESVDASMISTQAYGERNPVVDTADGVREPQNRRVEIKLETSR